MAAGPSPRTVFAEQVGIEVPLICGAMYPCSNPELVAAVSAAGGIGVVQPISLTYVHGHAFRDGLRLITRLAGGRPVGMNALIEQSSRAYRRRMEEWIDVALEEGVRFFVTSLGNPRWVADRVRPVGGVVYHDVTERRWAQKGLDGGAQGLIAVNDRAGGHAGRRTAEQLLAELGDLGVPLIQAGGVATPADFARSLAMGYAGVQMGTRFIATDECRANEEYKRAIVGAEPADIVLTERLTGVPVAVIENGYVRRLGTRAGLLSRALLRNRRTKHWMRTFYAIRSLRRLKRDSLSAGGRGDTEYWQAGKSVEGIDSVDSAASIVRRFADALD